LVQQQSYTTFINISTLKAMVALTSSWLHPRRQKVIGISSFPGYSHLQTLIMCKYGGRKAVMADLVMCGDVR